MANHYWKTSGLYCAGLVVGILFSACARVKAVTYGRKSPGGGPFTLGTAWLPDIPPNLVGPGGAGDDVEFNLGTPSSSPYTVTGVNGQNDRLLVGNDSLQLNIGTYSLLDTSVADASLTFGIANGDDSEVVLAGNGTGELNTQTANIAATPGGFANVTVNGLAWNAVLIKVGELAHGVLTVTNAAQISSSSGQIGAEIGSVGAVTIDGIGSSWNTTSLFEVGGKGSGALTVENGGTMTSAAGPISIGSLSGSTGNVTVTDPDSQWNVTGALLSIGNDGDGTLTVENGGSVSSIRCQIGADIGATGSVTVTGAGSIWFNSLDVQVGGSLSSPGGSASMTITDSGLVEVANTLKVWSPGTIVLDGGTLRVGQLDVEGGEFNWKAGTLNITRAGGLTIGAAGALGSEVLLNHNQHLQVDFGLSVQSGSTLFAASGIEAGSITVSTGGQMFLGGASQDFGAGLTNQGDLVFTEATTANGPVNNGGDGTITALADVTFNGLVVGDGSFFGPGTITFAGNFAPGASPASVSFDSSVALGDHNALSIELGGTVAGNQFDRLVVGGNLAMGGSLDVSLIDSFSPAAGNSFDILDWSTTSGSFASINLPALASGLMWNASRLATAGVLSVQLVGDYNGNGVVDAADYIVWRKALGQSGVGLAADGNGNGKVDEGDYVVWQTNFGQSAIAAATTINDPATVPEPASLILAMIGAAAISASARVRPRHR
ncbi:MAG TPA: dockerin type I domain-containing protein [Lacipirellulaceae bacterium]|nr:dockerin type I domain-containing protein [Lacipirellulaceae bacterium]